MHDPQGTSTASPDPTPRGTRVNELKARVQADRYIVDPHRVAEALLRRPLARRALTQVVNPRDAGGRASSAARQLRGT
jgi:hypothetical protein